MGYLVTQELRRVVGEPTSAGRVQSPALYLVVLCEREIKNFKVVHHFGGLTFKGETTGMDRTAVWQPIPDFASRENPYIQDGTLAARGAATRAVSHFLRQAVWEERIQLYESLTRPTFTPPPRP